MTTLKILGDRIRTIRYDPDLANRLNREAELQELEEKRKALLGKRAPPIVPAPEPAPEPAPQPRTVEEPTFGKYILMPQASTYALGLHALQEKCVQENNQHQPQITLPNGKKVYRANTFLENIEARMNDWETEKNPAGSVRTEEERKRFGLKKRLLKWSKKLGITHSFQLLNHLSIS